MTVNKTADAIRKLNWVCNFIKPPGNFLDYGFGDGKILYEAKKRGFKVFGVEKDLTKAVKVSNYAHTFHYDEIGDYFPENYFKVIVCQSVLQYVDNPEDYIAYFQKWLTPDGHLFITTLNKWWPPNWFKQKKRLCSYFDFVYYLRFFPDKTIILNKNVIAIRASKRAMP